MNDQEQPLAPFNATDEALTNDTQRLPGEEPPPLVPPTDAKGATAETASKPFNWLPLLTVVCTLNFIGLVLVLFRLGTLSYYDIKDAPIIYYAQADEIVANAMMQADPAKAQSELIERLKNTHGLVLNDESVVIASPEFKLFPTNTVNGESSNK